MRIRNKFADTDVLEVIEAHATDINGVPYVFIAGYRVAGNHPAVKQNPQFFAPIGTPHPEIAEQLRDLHARPAVEPDSITRTRISKRLNDADCLVPKTPIAGIVAGQRVAKNDPRVDALGREHFADVLPKGVDRANALIATAYMHQLENDGSETVVYAGQLMPRDHKFVTLHPHNWQLPLHEES